MTSLHQLFDMLAGSIAIGTTLGLIVVVVTTLRHKRTRAPCARCHGSKVVPASQFASGYEACGCARTP